MKWLAPAMMPWSGPFAPSKRFLAAHPFKIAAIPVTASFPTQPGFLLVLGPRVWVALVLALGAALST